MPCCSSGSRAAAKSMMDNVVPPSPASKVKVVKRDPSEDSVQVKVIETIRSPQRSAGSKGGEQSTDNTPSAPGIRAMSDQPLEPSEPSALSPRMANSNRFSFPKFARPGGSGAGSLTNKPRGNRASDDDQVSTGRVLFSTFLTKCYSHEVLDYWDMTTQYINLCKKHTVSEQAKELGRKMIAEFAVPNAPQKLDLGESVENPLVATLKSNNYTPETFDPTRRMLLKLLQGLRMEASIALGVKSPTSNAISVFLDEEERKMHRLILQRDVHPLLHRLRKSTTFTGGGGQQSGRSSGSGIMQKTSQVFSDVFAGQSRRSSGSRPRNSSKT